MEITTFSEILKGSKRCNSFSGAFQSGNIHKTKEGFVLSIWTNGSSASEPHDAIIIPYELVEEVIFALTRISR